MSSIVKTPTDRAFDYDYLAFSFDGKHSYEDFNIYRVNNGAGYQEQLNPELVEKTASAEGSDGQYYFSTNHSKINFNINIAFDDLREDKLRLMRQWLNGKNVADLWFAETPYKVYSAKITGRPQLTVIPFDDNGETVYKGTGNLQFVCFQPYAHTPDYVDDASKDGHLFSSYANFPNRNAWQTAKVVLEEGTPCRGENLGDLPAPFKLVAKNAVAKGTKYHVGTFVITIHEDCAGFVWNSATGLVTIETSMGPRVILTSGDTCATIPVSDNGSVVNIKIEKPDTTILQGNDCFGEIELNYNYWYY